MPRINEEAIRNTAAAVSRLKAFVQRELPAELLAPGLSAKPVGGREEQILFYLVMVSMDHRLSRPGRSYEAFIDGKKLHGADLLWYLGLKKFYEDPGFFDPRNLAKLTTEDVIKWLSIGGSSPPDPEIRAYLLRDLGYKLCRLYECSAALIVDTAESYLRRDNGAGFLSNLAIFHAYRDPVEKKSFLLAKMLANRGLAKFVDRNNFRVAVDNHLTRIALRLHLVELEESILRKIVGEMPATYEEDILIRFSVREAWHQVALLSGIDDFELDDYLWVFGRSICRRDDPLCGSCPLRHVCPGAVSGFKPVEHYYYNTWYY